MPRSSAMLVLALLMGCTVTQDLGDRPDGGDAFAPDGDRQEQGEYDAGTYCPPDDPGCGGDADVGPEWECLPVTQEDLGSALGSELWAGETGGADLGDEFACTMHDGDEVAFLWRAPAGSTYLFEARSSEFAPAVSVIARDCSHLAYAAAHHNFGFPMHARAFLPLEAGQIVYVVVATCPDDADGVVAGADGLFALGITEPPDSEAGSCRNGFDDDGDGLADCEDSDCPGCFETDCGNGIDDNDDGWVDCMTLECRFTDACVESDCADGLDDESIYGSGLPGDGRIDCDDLDCWGSPDCAEHLRCADGVDNDGDGRTDCEDSECRCDPTCRVDRCPDVDLGSVLGWPAATGDLTLSYACDHRAGSCGGGSAGGGSRGGPDVSFLWTAPEAGVYTFDTFLSFPTVLYALDGACGGAELACNDDWLDRWGSPHMTGFASITLTLERGQQIVVVVDTESDYGSTVPGHQEDRRPFQLNITEGPVGYWPS